MSQYVPTRYKVLCIIDKRCRVRIYIQVRQGIYMSLRGQVRPRIIAMPSHNNASGQCRDNKIKITVFKPGLLNITPKPVITIFPVLIINAL